MIKNVNIFMIQYCLNLSKLSIHPIPLEFHSTLKIKHQAKIDNKVLNKNLKEMFSQKGIYVSSITSFFSIPYFRLPIHVDDYGGDFIRLNYVYCDGKSSMNWYRLKKGVRVDIEDIKKPTSIGTYFCRYHPDQVEKVATDELVFPSLVQVGCPHDVINQDKPRLCIALCLNNITDGSRLTMEQAYNKLSFLI